MKIGIISDSHDNIWNLARAFVELKKHGIETLLHCGDLCAPFMIAELEKLGVPVHVVFGNIDDRYYTPLLASKSKLLKHHGEIAELEIDGKRIAVTHYPHFAEGLAATGKYDAVFHGHTHDKYKDKIGKALICNPGEIMGRKGKPTFAVYDTAKNEIYHYEF
jgi:uncharacterized protein